tara:strand:+ start:5760 stop:6425 length:666 start_codon:yes stop_codon:yes gene_type:complete
MNNFPINFDANDMTSGLTNTTESPLTKGLVDRNATTASLLNNASTKALPIRTSSQLISGDVAAAPAEEAAPAASGGSSIAEGAGAVLGVASAAVGVVEAFDQAEMNNAAINNIEKNLEAGLMLGSRSSGKQKASAAVTGNRAALSDITNTQRQADHAAMREAAMAVSQLESDTTSGFVSAGINMVGSVAAAGGTFASMGGGAAGGTSMAGGGGMGAMSGMA